MEHNYTNLHQFLSNIELPPEMKPEPTKPLVRKTHDTAIYYVVLFGLVAAAAMGFAINSVLGMIALLWVIGHLFSNYVKSREDKLLNEMATITDWVIAANKHFIASSPMGELADKYTILKIKYPILNPAEQEDILSQLSSVMLAMHYVIHTTPNGQWKVGKLIRLIEELESSNREQWKLEDYVRSDMNPGYWAKKARDQNNTRVVIKNKINDLFGQLGEYKRYA